MKVLSIVGKDDVVPFLPWQQEICGGCRDIGTYIQQSHKMVTHLPVAFIEIVSVPFAPTFHIHVNQVIPHKDIRLLDILLKRQ
jgi:hypothetical protein